MWILEQHGGFLYEHKKSLFPEGEITGTELLLWYFYYEDKQRRRMKR